MNRLGDNSEENCKIFAFRDNCDYYCNVDSSVYHNWFSCKD